MDAPEPANVEDASAEQPQAAGPPPTEPAEARGDQPTDTPAADAAAEVGKQTQPKTPEDELAELREKNLRLLAETRNLQQRARRDQAEAIKYAEADFARDLLVILDDLERTRESAQSAKKAKAVADGVRIVYEHFLKVLEGRSIEPIEALGKPFDPAVHEALQQQPSDQHPAGTVMQEIARGYKMHQRVLRPSRVIVSSGPPPAPESKDSNTEMKSAKE